MILERPFRENLMCFTKAELPDLPEPNLPAFGQTQESTFFAYFWNIKYLSILSKKKSQQWKFLEYKFFKAHTLFVCFLR